MNNWVPISLTVTQSFQNNIQFFHCKGASGGWNFLQRRRKRFRFVVWGFPYLICQVICKGFGPRRFRNQFSFGINEISRSRAEVLAQCARSAPLLDGRAMEVFLEVGHNKLLFIFSSKFLNFIAILLHFINREVGTSLKRGDIFQGRRRNLWLFRRNRERGDERYVFADQLQQAEILFIWRKREPQVSVITYIRGRKRGSAGA